MLAPDREANRRHDSRYAVTLNPTNHRKEHDRTVIADDAELLSQGAQSAITAANLLERLDLERLDISHRLAVDPQHRADLGQFFTPAKVAAFMASMLDMPNAPQELRILDPGGGSGILTAAAVSELCSWPESKRPSAVHATVWEIDQRLSEDITRTFEHCQSVCRAARISFTGELHEENFILRGP